jgi:hypothetical protein
MQHYCERYLRDRALGHSNAEPRLAADTDADVRGANRGCARALRDTPMPFEHYKDIVESGKWAEIERRYGR